MNLHLLLQAGYDYCYDTLTIYNGVEPGSGVLASLCGPYGDGHSGDTMVPPDPIHHPASK